MFRRFIFGLAVVLGACADTGHTAEAEPAQETEAVQETETCARLLANGATLPAALVARLGPWESCGRTAYSESEFGAEETLLMEWPNVKLTVDFKLPETSIYIVEVTGESALTSEWYEAERENLVSAFFEMNWGYDGFPGPSAEYYVSKDEGANGQIWVERGPDGAVEWLRFSYAL